VRKCQICKENEYVWIWQPLGPDEDVKESFCLPGGHFRGFPTIAVCPQCKVDIQTGKETRYTYQGTEYIVNQDQAEEEAITDYMLHMHRLLTDQKYADWQEEFRGRWHFQGFKARGHLPHAFIMQLHDAGYSPDEALDLFKIADAEAYARHMEMVEVEQQAQTA